MAKRAETRFRGFAKHKDVLDTVNSLSWFLMDACWMMGFFPAAFLASPVVVLSGFLLCLIDRRPAFVAINIGIICWIFMNLSWMISDVHNKEAWLLASRCFFVLGVLGIGAAIYLSKNLRETFSQFRRFRIKDWA